MALWLHQHKNRKMAGMERNTRARKQRLAHTDGGAMNILDSLIRETIEDSRPPDANEFTVADYARGINVTIDAAYNRLRRKVKAGEIVVRKASLDGILLNIYSSPH